MLRRFLGAGALSSLGMVAVAHNGATGVVMDRMMGMTVMRDVMAGLAPMMRGEVPFDVRAVQEDAARIIAHSGDNMNRLFPEGSLQAASYAKPEIWTEWEDFAALSEQLKTYALGLGMAAPNGLTAPEPVAPHASHGALINHGMMPMEAPSETTESSGGGMMDHSMMQMGTSSEAAEAPATRYSVAELMGVVQPAGLARSAPKSSPEAAVDFAMMAADDAFERVSQVCSSCHARFRSGN